MKRKKQSNKEIRELAVASYYRRELTVSQIAKNYNVSRSTLMRWVDQSKISRGKEKFIQKKGRGRKKKIGADSKLFTIIDSPATEYGFEDELWTTGRIQNILERVYKITISKVQIWKYLMKTGFSYKKPDKAYYNQDADKRKQWLKNDFPKILEIAKKTKAIIYFEDEASIAIQPKIGKSWIRKGVSKVVKVASQRGSVSVISAISTTGKLLFTLPKERVNSNTIINFLTQILKHHKNRNIIVIMDSAKTHTSKMTKSFVASEKRLKVFYQPPYSPDLNPDELVWAVLKNKKMISQTAKTKEEVRALANRKLKSMQKNSKMIKGFIKKIYNVPLFN